MSMSLSQARLVDPVLTQHVRGYRNATFVGMELFPPVDVEVAAGQVIEFGREAFLRYNARRAPGATTKRVSFGHFGKPYRLFNDALDATVPRELQRDAKQVPEVDLGMRATNVTMRAMTLGLEIEQAEMARDAANYPAANKVTLTGSSQWSHADSAPMDAIDTGMEAVRAATGLYPNVALLPAKVWRRLRRHPKILAGITNNTGVISEDMLATIIGVRRVVVAGAVEAPNDVAVNPPLGPFTGAFTDVWGKDVILAYVATNPEGMEEPSFGYTYRLRGHPMVEQARYDGDTKSWIYGVSYERAPQLTGMSAGYLIKDAIA